MLVGFSGKIGSGKDAAGIRLGYLTDWETEHLSFARKLKESAAALFDIDMEAWESYKNDPLVRIRLVEIIMDCGTVPDGEELIVADFSAREFLQRYGTESHRAVFDDDFWVEQAMKNYHRLPELVYYFTDCRFENEAQAIKQRGGVIIKVIGLDEETGDHVSESGLPEYLIDFQIDNNVRNDNFYNLDRRLASLCVNTLGIPIATERIGK